MNDTVDKPQPPRESIEENFENMFQRSLNEPREGEVLKGKVVRITEDTVLVDIGCKAEGAIPLREFIDKDGKPAVNVGDEICALLLRLEDDAGRVVLSKAGAEHAMAREEIRESNEKGKNVSGVIIKAVTGGFHVDIKGVMAFLPGSQADLKPVRDASKLVGTNCGFRVIKYDPRKNNVIVSRRIVMEEERERIRKFTLENLREGALLEGIVKNITDYGAFIDLGGIDGLLHLSDISWGKIGHPSQVLKLGDRIKTLVIKYDKAENRISLGLKQTRPDPWKTAKERYPAGTKVSGRVTNIADYGAFVEIEEGLEGLIHISELSWTKLKHPSHKLKPSDRVEVVVLDVDMEARRLSLGMKQLEPNPWDELSLRYPKNTRVKGIVKNVTDFGVFVGIGEAIDGLVHIGDLTWKKIKHPSEVFSKGQEIEAVVLNVDGANQRFSLSTKLIENNPWHNVDERYKPGMIIEGRVTNIAPFGAFVELAEGIEGLVHISELMRGKKKGNVVKEGDGVEVEVLNVNNEEKKIGLGIRKIKGSKDEPQRSGGGE